MRYDILIADILVVLITMVQLYKIYLNIDRIELKKTTLIKDTVILCILIIDLLVLGDNNITTIKTIISIIIAIIMLMEARYVIVENKKNSKTRMSNKSIKEAIDLSKDGILVLNNQEDKIIVNETMQELLEKLNINSSYFSNIENNALKKINTDYLVLVENKAWVFNINKKYNEMTCFDVDEEYKLHAILEKQNKEIQKNNEKILWTLENMQYIENEKEVQEMKNKYHDLLRAEFVVIASIFNK